MDVDAPSASMTFAENGQGATLWLNPVYRNNSSSGLANEGHGYSLDLDLTGVVLGADVALGSGDSNGSGQSLGQAQARFTF